MSTITEDIEELRELLREDYYELSNIGDDWDGFQTVDVVEGEDRRWSRTIYVITSTPEGAYLRWQYEHGLTEEQENEFHPRNPIVVVAEFKKVVTTTEWVPV